MATFLVLWNPDNEKDEARRWDAAGERMKRLSFSEDYWSIGQLNKHTKQLKPGDQALLYRTQHERGIVRRGIFRSTAHPNMKRETASKRGSERRRRGPVVR